MARVTPKTPAKSSVLPIHKKRLIFLGGGFIILALIVGAAVFFTQNVNKTKNRTLASALTDQASEPGTYVAIKIDSGDSSRIHGLESCQKIVSYADGVSCKLDDNDPAITLTAEAAIVRDNVRYVFVSWDGCLQALGDSLSCTITINPGAVLNISANYAEDSGELSAGDDQLVPHVIATVEGMPFDSRTPPPNIGMTTVNIPQGQKSAMVTMKISTYGLSLSDCKIVDHVTLDDILFTK